MIKIKNKGFSLSEVLITLTIVAILAALVLPGIIKDSQNKANMALLQGTVGDISNAVQQELMRTNAKSIDNTDIYSDPNAFLKRSFDYTRDNDIFKTQNDEGEMVDVTYKSINGVEKGGTHPLGQIILKNGVYIGIAPNIDTVVIDLNGPESPNIIGLDYFALELVRKTDETTGQHFGDVGAFRYDNKSDSTLKSECKAGEAAKCYALVERSGFDPNYLE
jgi:prepilin-type N-terminal cleavage/methylation domain-containing protein